MRVLLLFCVFLLLLTSCKEKMIGLCDSPFETQVGQPTIEGDYKVFVVSVKNNRDWWLSGITIDGNRDDIDMEGLERKESYFIEKKYYTFEKVSPSLIIVKLKNLENKPLKLFVTLQLGNCFGGFGLEN